MVESGLGSAINRPIRLTTSREPFGTSGLRGSPPNFAGSDFAQSNDNVTIIRENERLRSFQELPCSFRGEQDEFKATRNIIQTVFNGDSSHTRTVDSPRAEHKGNL